jgi:hypothetical protein
MANEKYEMPNGKSLSCCYGWMRLSKKKGQAALPVPKVQKQGQAGMPVLQF